MSLFRNVVHALNGKTGYVYVGNLLVKAANIKVIDDMVEIVVAEPTNIPNKIISHIDNIVLAENV